ncbi:MAG TPA: phosphoribosylformylglycinamidine cyclo-ligase [Candidatus Manganitrophaceae bacterium]|nr:phosphoribosylformylglycinamidine cyclo-ligase [Candidatus Manganitrophaceae bacterium]
MAKLTYKNAGVDIKAGDRFVQKITPLVRSTFRPEVLTDLGGFSGLFSLRAKKFKEPVLVSGTDGVGTKLKIAFMTDRHDTVGIDLVAMCVNDVAVTGAEPLFFLDYFATGKLYPKKGVEVMKGIVEGCRQAGCALIGGETAEMPSFYADGEYDLAGFSVGVVEKKKIIDGRKIRPGDRLIGLASSGLHSNGFSLVRKVFFEKNGLTVKDRLPGLSKPLGEALLTPTVIYAKTVLKAIEKIDLKGAAHITGGGITENLPRILPKGCAARVRRDQWEVPSIFKILQAMGEIDPEEMYSDFNMGVGMIWAVSEKDLRPALSLLKRLRQEAFPIGEVVRGNREVIYA